MKTSTVLSLSFDSEELAHREAALRRRGFEVVSVASPAQARFEIEMGRCGVFLTSSIIADLINADLFDIFRKNCQEGVTVYVTGSNTPANSRTPKADLVIARSEGEESMVNALVGRLAGLNKGQFPSNHGEFPEQEREGYR